MSMSDTLPAPLVPAHVDLRGLPYMPLAVNRLRDSDLAIKASGDVFRAAVLLWCTSWSQVPAASLPDDEETLAAYAGYARDLKGWRKIKAGALRGYVLCDDGRLYHPVVAAYALEAWSEREEYRAEKDNVDARKTRERAWRKAAYAALREVGVIPHWNEKTTALRDLVKQHGVVVTAPDGRPVTPLVTGDVTPPVTVTGHAPDTANKGQGSDSEGTGIDEEQQSSLRSDSSSAAPTTAGGGDQSDADKRRKLEEGAQRLRQHTLNAITAFNATLGKPNGLLASVSTRVGLDTRDTHVKRCLKTASEICLEVHENPAVTAEFWEEYFNLCAADPFKSGQQPPGKGHENWEPSFEYLTRKAVMLEMFDRATSAGDGE